MKKSELLKGLWVPIRKRLPPETNQIVLCWNWKTNTVHEWEAFIARSHAKVELGISDFDEAPDSLSWDRRISHWTHFTGPRGEPLRYIGDAVAQQSKDTRKRRG